MATIKAHTLSGFMELLPDAQTQMERLMEVLRTSYGVYGFTPLDTPIIEASDVLLAKGGGETEKQIYRFSKGDSDLSLRFDLTVPLAKYVALHYADLAFPFRRFQIGKVYRGERAQRGRFREFYQADIDIIGDGELDITNDAEIPAIIYTVFSRLGLKRFQIRINNRRILNGFYAMLGLSDKAGDIMRTVDKIEKIGAELVRAILVDDYAIEGEKADEILAFIGIKGTNAEVLAALEQYRGRNEVFDQGLDELSTVAKYLGSFGVPQENFAVDLTIARGLDYYTGTVYETTLLDYPEIGSVCSGGRFDNLAEYYIDRKLPGVGISIGVTRLFYVLGEQGLLNGEVCTAPADVLILPMTEDLSDAIALATDLRAAGVSTQIYTEKKKFKAKMNYADKLKVPYVYFLGEDEIAAGVVSCKDMRTGEQVKLPRAEAVQKAKAFVEADRRKLHFMSQTHAPQGVIALAAVKEYCTVDDIFEVANERGEQPFIIICDEISDPHNLGAIIRSAECAGAHGVIIPKRRSAGLTAIVDKSSAGAAEHMAIARVPNLPAAIKDIKARGVWVYGTAAGGQSDLWHTDLSGAVALVIGSEGDGMGRLVSESCDFIISLPMRGKVSSLNASTAAAITMYEVLRQRSMH